MNWLSDNWRLKLLALGLSLGLYLTVALGLNPPVQVAVRTQINYVNLPADVVLVPFNNQAVPTTLSINVDGLRDAVVGMPPSSVVVVCDMARVHSAAGLQVVHANVHASAPGVRPETDSIELNLHVDERQTADLPIEPRLRFGPGWEAVGAPVISPGNRLHFIGPAAFVRDAHAYVDPGAAVAASSLDTPNLPVRFEIQGQPVAPPLTVPAITFDPPLVDLHVDARKPNQSRRVTLIEDPTGTPAPGYRITDVVITPLFVTVTGPVDDISALESISLAPINVDGATADRASNRVQVPLRPGLSVDTQFVSVRVVIQQNPVVHVTPSPTPGPTPTPSPSPTP